MQITAEMIRGLAPRARQGYVDAIVNGGDILERWGFNTPLRLAALLANACHETQGLTIVRESLHYTTPERLMAVWPSRFRSRRKAKRYLRNERELGNLVYGGRLGNQRNGVHDNDGFDYRGGGLGQTTGFDNYERLGQKLGIPLGANPSLIEDPRISLEGLCLELSDAIEFCDMGERGFKSVCNLLNRGSAFSRYDPINWSDRQVWYTRWSLALGAAKVHEANLLRRGDRGPLVEVLQKRLRELGYRPGGADGVFGSLTRAAVLAFQAENHLKTDGIAGPLTQEALNSDSAIPMPLGERATETVADLKAKGSETIATTQAVKNAAGAGAIASGTVGAVQTAIAEKEPFDLVGTTKDVVNEVSSWKAIVTTIGDTFIWATSHWWIFAIVVLFAAYRWGNKIELRRLWEHRTGLNLGR